MQDKPEDKVRKLLREGPKVINMGLEEFADSLKSKGVPVLHVKWKPPAMGDKGLLELLDKLR